jgi:hypothetical protein
VADPKSIRIQRHGSSWLKKSQSHECEGLSMCESERPQQAQWLPEPNVDRVVDGLPNRVGRIRGLGNSIVPQVAAEIIRCIVEVSK